MSARITLLCLFALHAWIVSAEVQGTEILGVSNAREGINLLIEGGTNEYMIVSSPTVAGGSWSVNSEVTFVSLGDGLFLASAPTPATRTQFYRLMRINSAPDLVGWFGALSFPTETVAGIETMGSAALVVVNQGNSPGPVLPFPVARLFARRSDGGSDFPLITLDSHSATGLWPGQFETLRFDFGFPTNLPSGEYHVVAVLDPLNRLPEISESNNEAIESTTRRVVQPFIDLFIQMKLTSLASTVRATDFGTATLTLGNRGNVLAHGAADLEVFASKDLRVGPDDYLLGRVTNYLIAIPPSKATDLRMDIEFPLGIKGDQYYVIAKMDPRTGISDANNTNHITSNPTVYEVSQEVSLDQFRGYDVPGRSWDYECLATARVSGVFGDATATEAFILSVRVLDISDALLKATRTITSRGGKTMETADWQIGSNGARLISQSSITGKSDFTMTFEGMDVAPEAFDPLSDRILAWEGPFSGTTTNHIDGFPEVLQSDGKMRSALQPLGYEDIQLPTGAQFKKALKYRLAFSSTWTAKVEGTEGPINVDYTMDVNSTVWAALGIGPVKTETDSVLTVQKQGSSDRGAIESHFVAVLAAPKAELSHALDNASLVWLSPTSPGWQSQTASTHDGVDAAKSTAVPNNGRTAMQTTVSGPGEISFWWKVSSEQNFDFVRFRVNGKEEASLSGLADWASVSFVVPEGLHTLEWVYDKDEEAHEGEDTAWVDEVRWIPEKSVFFEDLRVFDIAGTSWDYEVSTSFELSGGYGNQTITDAGIYNVRVEGLTGALDKTRVITSRAGKTLGSVDWKFDESGSQMTARAEFGENLSYNFDITPLMVAPPVIYPKSGRAYLGSADFDAKVTSNETNSNYAFQITGQSESNLRLLGYQDVILQSGARFEEALKFELSIVSKSTAFVVVDGAPVSLGEFVVNDVQTAWAVQGTGIVKSVNQLHSTISQEGRTPLASLLTSTSMELTSAKPGLLSALDDSSLIWLSPSGLGWRSQTNVTHDGLDAAQSASIVADQNTAMQTSVRGAGELSFWWKVSSERDSDFVRFKIDGKDQAELSGDVDWRKEVIFVPDGPHFLEWLYVKDQADSAGFDTAWVDEVSFSPDLTAPWVQTHPLEQRVIEGFPVQFQVTARGLFPLRYQWEKDGVPLLGQTGTVLNIPQAALTDIGSYRVVVSNSKGVAESQVARLVVSPVRDLSDAVDFSGVWTSTGPMPWIGQSEVTHDGTDAAQSGHGFHGGGSVLTTAVTGPGTVSFVWKVSTDPDGWDYLNFSISGVKQARIDGETPWTQVSAFVPAGEKMLEWMYWKDGDRESFGEDAGWVDEVRFTPDQTAPIILTHPESRTFALGAEASLGVEARGKWPLQYQWVKDGLPISGATNQVLVIPNAQVEHTGQYQARVINSVGSTISSVANLLVQWECTLGNALGAPLPWSTGGSREWTCQTNTTHDLVAAARSGSASDNQFSYLDTQITGPGRLSFWWKVSSEQGFDILRFVVDGATHEQISGEKDWELVSVDLPSGTHTLRWIYDKDDGTSTGADSAWVDEVSFERASANNALPIPENSKR